MTKNILVVGAGFAGAVHARSLAESGCDVTVIDSRPHIGGNCFDEIHGNGVRVHRYGPHLFHTSNMRVVEWLSRFTDWVPYEHKVVARMPDGGMLPLPVNLDTVNGVFGTAISTPEELAAFLRSEAEAVPDIRSAEDYLLSTIGRRLTDLFFRPYTKKMWEMDLSEVDANVVKRVQVRAGSDDRYFPNDTFQAMPRDGYTAVFEKIFDHPRIQVRTGTDFAYAMLDDYDFCFNSMPIDVFFQQKFGELPYRSIRFHLFEEDAATASPHVTINYTDAGPFTRETWWHNIPNHHPRQTGTVLRTVEEPCDYRDNDFQRFYPVKTHDGRHEAIYDRYKALAAGQRNLAFIGRCGTYQYLDMHQVINQSMKSAQDWLMAREAA
jgi:UDP-galactopyranose mutase